MQTFSYLNKGKHSSIITKVKIPLSQQRQTFFCFNKGLHYFQITKGNTASISSMAVTTSILLETEIILSH